MSTTPSTRATYINHGGIGFVVDASGVLPIPDQCRTQTLRLVAEFDRRTIREVQPPASGWTDESLVAALEPHRTYVDSFAPVDAYLGEICIGSTET